MPIILDEMMDTHITRRDMLPLSFLKMSSYTGSKRQLRYKLEKTEMEVPAMESAEKPAAEPEKITVLRIYTWTGPFAFDVTPAEEMQTHDVEFSDAGIDEAIEYLNECLDKL